LLRGALGSGGFARGGARKPASGGGPSTIAPRGFRVEENVAFLVQNIRLYTR
jgi:hypothetical protein